MTHSLPARLASAQRHVTRVGEAARARGEHLRAELAAVDHTLAAAASAHRLAAAQLERGLRGTGRGLARLAERSPGEPVLVGYVPPVSPVGLTVRPGPSPWARVWRGRVGPL